MSDAEDQAQGEPTMEEILASIRRIISEDAPEGEDEAEAAEAEAEAEAEAPPVEEPEDMPPVVEEEAPEEAADDDDEDALELTQMVTEDGSVVDLNAQREAARSRAEEPEPPEQGEEPEIDLAEPAAPDDEPSILEDTTRSAATSSLLNLAHMADQQNISGLTEGGNRTLEMLVRETLEPHLKVWLDANLPVLVERIVREEIQKMVKRAEYR